MISLPALPSIVSSAVRLSVCWKVKVSSLEEPTSFRLPAAVDLISIAVDIKEAPAVSSPVDKVPLPAKLNDRPGLDAKTASLIVKSLPDGIVQLSVFEIVERFAAVRF